MVRPLVLVMGDVFPNQCMTRIPGFRQEFHRTAQGRNCWNWDAFLFTATWSRLRETISPATGVFRRRTSPGGCFRRSQRTPQQAARGQGADGGNIKTGTVSIGFGCLGRLQKKNI